METLAFSKHLIYREELVESLGDLLNQVQQFQIRVPGGQRGERRSEQDHREQQGSTRAGWDPHHRETVRMSPRKHDLKTQDGYSRPASSAPNTSEDAKFTSGLDCQNKRPVREFPGVTAATSGGPGGNCSKHQLLILLKILITIFKSMIHNTPYYY